MLMVLGIHRLALALTTAALVVMTVEASSSSQPVLTATCIGPSTEGVSRFIAQIRGVLVDQSGQVSRQQFGLQAISANEIAVTTDSVACQRVRSLDLATVQSNNNGQPPDSIFTRTFLVARAGPYWVYRKHHSNNDPDVTGIRIANDSLTRVIVRFR
jgi:hypothetical protein